MGPAGSGRSGSISASTPDLLLRPLLDSAGHPGGRCMLSYVFILPSHSLALFPCITDSRIHSDTWVAAFQGSQSAQLTHSSASSVPSDTRSRTRRLPAHLRLPKAGTASSKLCAYYPNLPDGSVPDLFKRALPALSAPHRSLKLILLTFHRTKSPP